jgi:hypothetical protein
MLSSRDPSEAQMEISTLCQNTYLPELGQTSATRRHSYARLAVVEASKPDQACGIAVRIGYVSTEADALAMYRLKIRRAGQAAHSRAFITLTDIFVLEHHVFAVFSPAKQKD